MKVWAIKIIVIIGLFTSCKKEEQKKCELKSLIRIEVSPTMYKGKTEYFHRLVVKNYTKSCFDSITAIQLLKKYIDTVSVYKPVKTVIFHNSGEWYFHPSPWIREARSDPDQIDDVLVLIQILPDGKYNFVFYDNYSKMIYNGPNYSSWRGRN